MGVSGFNPHSMDFTYAPDIREILGLEGRTDILPASFYGSNVIDITRNRQVILVYSSLVRSSDMKIANRNNNLLTTMIIDDPMTNSVDRWRTSAPYDNPTRSIDVCIQGLGRQYHAIERRIRAPVLECGPGLRVG